jgi:hypothetical protein
MLAPLTNLFSPLFKYSHPSPEVGGYAGGVPGFVEFFSDIGKNNPD